MTPPARAPLTYRDAGVSIHAADEFVAGIADVVSTTGTGAVVDAPAAFAGLLRLDLTGVDDPLLAATCDGVGTKLLVAREMGMFEGLGQDLVAMNVNDLLPVGARPLLFLDYIATGKLVPEELNALVRGMAAACRESGCVLLGGETAEMPGVYKDGGFDLAGFAVGVVDAVRVPDRESIAAGDEVVALPSAGIHANGLSLARRALLDRGGLRLGDEVGSLGRTLGAELLEPTALYVDAALALMETGSVKAAAHVTGGGLLGRATSILPPDLGMRIDPDTFARPHIFDLIQSHGDVASLEMARTFNMGLGFLAIVDASVTTDEAARDWIHIGEIVADHRGVDLGYAHG